MLKKVFDYVELRTKVTTTGAFLLALSYIFYERQPINWELTILFFISMMAMDLATTAINNYIDTKKSGQALGINRKLGLWIIISLLVISIFVGIYLVYLTDIIVLLLGGLCFVCGILYTWGPAPISRLPLGELFSGVIQGFIGPFILIYITMPDGTYMDFALSDGAFDIRLMILPLIAVILLTVPTVCTIADVMLANNICDREKDIEHGRYTLAYYLKKKSLYLFAALYYISYAANVLMVLLGLAPVVLLVSLLTIIPVQRNINKFFKVQEKARTFYYSIINYLLIVCANIAFMIIGRLIGG